MPCFLILNAQILMSNIFYSIMQLNLQKKTSLSHTWFSMRMMPPLQVILPLQ